MGANITADVVVPTYRRPSYVRECLEHLSRQELRPRQVVVVDASPDEDTYSVVTDCFPDVRYVRNPFGAGCTATSRSLGVRLCTADVVAFVDDDAYARPDWLERLLAPYADATVGGVGGRALNNEPGEETEGADRIGRFLPDGSLTGYFAANPGTDIDVDHLLGANMSFRREALRQIGGIRDHYPGTCLREETDVALRVRAVGWRLVFTPGAVVDHVAGTYAKGRRFDLRYTYYSQRNHLVLLSRTVGAGSQVYRRYLGVASREIGGKGGDSARSAARLHPRGFVGGIARAGAASAGLLAGVRAGVTQRDRSEDRP
jgi:GT2 family glycosyltransferase